MKALRTFLASLALALVAAISFAAGANAQAEV